MRNWIDSKTYDMMIKASLGVSLPVVIVTAVMFFTGEPITSVERKLAGYILVPSLIVFIWSFFSLVVDFGLQFFKPIYVDESGNSDSSVNKEVLKSQFVARFVTDDHKYEPIYDAIDDVLNKRKEGAFAAKTMISAADKHLKWLSSVPSGKKMAYYFSEEAIGSISSFDTGKSAHKDDTDAALNDIITILTTTLKVHKDKKLEEAKANSKK
ncbi:MAG: hypothetical protein E7101_02620 [Prevotella ruminicola]|uniref:Uncharacterized protein n=1 Tax=Xylanibacter ruminicola TaxID=839 RepID=A0A9D5NY90_XYLRU|nr:hypothetical protein [Xylanibacter ruminicola]